VILKLKNNKQTTIKLTSNQMVHLIEEDKAAGMQGERIKCQKVVYVNGLDVF
jgi:hypothetical protein